MSLKKAWNSWWVLLSFYWWLEGQKFQIWDHFLTIIFPKDSENLKSMDISLWEKGAKRHLNGVNKGRKKCVTNFWLPPTLWPDPNGNCFIAESHPLVKNTLANRPVHEFRLLPQWSPIPVVKVSEWFPCQTFTDADGQVVRVLEMCNVSCRAERFSDYLHV